MLRDSCGVLQSFKRPNPRRVRVGHRLKSSKRLGRNDEQRLLRIQVARRLGNICTVDVLYEPEIQIPLRIVAHSFVRHDRPKVGAANSDVDDIADRLSGIALPLAAAHAV